MTEAHSDEKTIPAPDALPAKKRLLSLDALRGFDLFLLLFLGPFITSLAHEPLKSCFESSRSFQVIVDQLDHRSWYGFTLWDLVMPLFMFMAGVAIPYAMARYKKPDGEGTSISFWLRLFRRVLLLWILGMIAQGNLLDLKLEELRLFSNTLQAIAVGYFFSTLIYLFLRTPCQIGVTLLLLFGYWGLETFVTLGAEGEIGGGTFIRNQTLAEWVDHAVMVGHWHPGGIHTWILSGMTFTVTTMAGVFAGELTRRPFANHKDAAVMSGSKGETVGRTPHLNAVGTYGVFSAMLGIGAVLTLLGWAWGAIPEGTFGYCPLIKNMWSSSMTVLSAGLSFLFLAVFYLWLDVWQFRWGSGFLVVIGMNAITAYMIPYLVSLKTISKGLLYGTEQYIGPWYGPLIKLANFLIIYLIVWMMFRCKKFLRV